MAAVPSGVRTGGITMRIVIRTSLGILFAASLVWGQGTTAQIGGTVKDSTGLAVAGAAVQVTQIATALVRSTTSGQDGSYVFPNLPIGPYVLEITKAGF